MDSIWNMFMSVLNVQPLGGDQTVLSNRCINSSKTLNKIYVYYMYLYVSIIHGIL